MKVRLPRTPAAVDALIALLVQAAVTIPFVVPRDASLPPATWAAFAVTTLSVLPLLARSRAPLTVLFAIAAAQFAYLPLHGPGQPLPYAPLVMMFTISAQGRLWQRRFTVWVVLPLVVAAPALHTNTVREYLFTVFVFGMAYVLGVLARTRQAYTRAVEERAEELERSRQAEAERAAERERARIAREMHDILSHAVSLMIVQAEAGPLVVRSDPERAERAFDAIADAGRDAMVQLRRMLGVLKEEPAGERRPQPTLEGLAALVAEVRRAGLPVALTVSGEPGALAADAQVTVYRVVQEALTNVLKHAEATEVSVCLDWSPRRLAVRVENDGGRSRRSRTGSGQGLIGIRERAAAHGGTASAGPGPGGRGFRVALELPLMISSRAEVVS
ncbi:sensor histidine kinase [Streptomyces sp. NPDC052396]|uniref:sensor histidine kinase n=1 Tax=Streptomyces sp. NPDC052396 TaxID=3365689 RepID=UPI0037CD0E31